MAKVPTVYLAVKADTREVKKNMSEAQKAFLGFQNSLKRGRSANKGFKADMLGHAKGAASAAVGMLALGTAIRSVVADVMTMQTLTIQLKTATGSAQSAKIKFKELVGTASKLPLSIEDATDAFVRLQNMGLDASERSIISFTNTASAMGKSLTQFVEAVADANTREFERLKEFGIKAKNEGDKIRFIFQGNEKVVENTSKSIVGYLRDLGENEFAGAAEEQMDTLAGAITNVKDAFFQLNIALGEGSGGALQNMAERFGNNIKDLAGIVEQSKFKNKSLDELTEADLPQLEVALGEAILKVDAMSKSTARGNRGYGNQKKLLADLRAAYERLTTAKEKNRVQALDQAAAEKAAADAAFKRTSAEQASSALASADAKIALDRAQREENIVILLKERNRLDAKAFEIRKKLELMTKGGFSNEDIEAAKVGFIEATTEADQLTAAIDQINKKGEQTQKTFQEFAEDVKRGFADAIVEGENFKGVLQSVLKEIAKTQILKAMSGLFGGGGTGTVGPLKVAGALATGGPVTANKSYLVGEKGPELFTPSGSGSITPNNRSFRDGGGGGSINIVNNFDINGGDGDVQQMIAQSVSTSVQLAVAKIGDNKRRRIS